MPVRPRRRRRHPLPAAAGDHGYGLVELLVAMALTSVLLVALGGVFASGLRTTSRLTAKVTATADARLVVDTMGRRLRVAVDPDSAPAAFVAPLSPTGATFYASISGGALGTTFPGNADPPETRVDYRVVPATQNGRATSCLQETLTPRAGAVAPYTFPASGAIVRCLAYGDINADGRPLLTYYQSGTSSTAATGPSDVRSVLVSLTVTSTSGGERATTAATTRVTLPNIRVLGVSP